MKIFFILLAIFISEKIVAQNVSPNNVNPKNQWYFGAEFGSNRITSLKLGEPNKTFQGGILAEYYFARHWSLSGKIKYFDTGVSFYDPGYNNSNSYFGSIFGSSRSAAGGTFRGAQIAIPLNIKWEFRIRKNLSANIKCGYVQIFETKSEYSNYVGSQKESALSKNYSVVNVGFGFNYFLNKKYCVYLDFETFEGAEKGYNSSVFAKSGHITTNSLTSIGVKYNFRN